MGYILLYIIIYITIIIINIITLLLLSCSRNIRLSQYLQVNCFPQYIFIAYNILI